MALIAHVAAAAFVRSYHSTQLRFLQASRFPEPIDADYGRREYWNDVYATQETFSWYTGWEELEPFVRVLVPLESSHVLIPGMGNDATVVDMYDSGYQNLTAFDYAEAGVDCAMRLLGNQRIRENCSTPGVTLLLADARGLSFKDCSFDAVLDKGTLDAIYLSGGKDKDLAAKHLDMAVSELGRVVMKGGVVVSVTAVCVDQVRKAFESSHWETIQDGRPYITEDGFASNNVDGTLLAWKRSLNWSCRCAVHCWTRSLKWIISESVWM